MTYFVLRMLLFNLQCIINAGFLIVGCNTAGHT